jgi:hypothetical protein
MSIITPTYISNKALNKKNSPKQEQYVIDHTPPNLSKTPAKIIEPETGAST